MPVEIFSMEAITPLTSDKVITLIQLIYGIPSFLLMILFFFFLGCSKNYSNSFYRLVQMDLLTNILCYFNTWFGARLEKHISGVMLLKSIESMAPGLLSWSRTFMNMFLHLQFCSSVALNIHRITSVVFFNSYDKFWSHFYPIYYLLSVIYSILLVWPNKMAVEVRLINDTLMGVYNWEVIGGLVYWNAIMSFVYFVLILVIGLITAFLVSRRVRNMSSDDHGISKKLTRIALTYCSLYTGILLWTVATAIDTYFPFLPKVITDVELELMVFSSDMAKITEKPSFLSPMPPLDPVTSSFGDKVITAIQLIYGVPSVMLMILFFIFFGCSKTFEGSFYRLVQLDLLTNILCYFNTWIGIRLEKHQIGVDLLKLLESLIPGSLSFSKLLLNFFLHMQFCSSMALNLHRISSVICYKNYERNWSRCYLLYALFSILYSTLPLLWIHRFAAEVTLINGTLSASYHMDVMSDLLFLNAICSIFYFLSILALGLITAFLISKIVKGFNNVDNSLSRKLSRITLIYCTLYSGILLWSIVRSIDSYFPFLPALFTTYKLDILMFSSDAMTLSLPYILIIFDRNLAFKKPRSNPGSRLAVFVSPSTANFN